MARRKLKVFQAQFGFYDTVVAAPSQAAALRAWGTHQNLFASGEAKVTTDEAAVTAASEQPEIPLRRAVGSTDPFALEPTSLPKIQEVSKKPSTRSAAKPKAPPTPKRPPADRSKLNAAETALHKLDQVRNSEEASLRREADELERRKSSAQTAYVDEHKAALAKIAQAKTAYREAGGE